MKAIVRGEILIPKRHVTKNMLEVYTYKQAIFGMPYDKTIRNYRKDKDYYYFPRNLTKIRLLTELPFDYQTSNGYEINFKMKFIPLEHQVKPINDIVKSFKSNLNILFRAKTRFGKTYSVVNVISKLKVNTLILVDKRILVSQFISDTKEYSDAAIIELNAKSMKDYDKSVDIYITTFQFMNSNKEFLNRITNDFGMVAVDECHSLVASTYRDVLYSFNSRYRLGVSATPTSRAHGLTPLITDSFEEVKVEGIYDGLLVDVFTHRLPRNYRLDINQPISPQYTDYFLLPENVEAIRELLISLKGYKIMLAIPNQKIQNHYATVAESLGFKVGIMNSESQNLKVKDETLRKFSSNELDVIIGLGQLIKGVSAPIEVIIDFFAVGNQESVEQLLGRARTVFEGRKCSRYIQLVSKYPTRKNDRVLRELKNLDMSIMKGEYNATTY